MVRKVVQPYLVVMSSSGNKCMNHDVNILSVCVCVQMILSHFGE